MKRFNDCIHGLIDIPSASLIFIDTPVFQRLRNLKQLGTTSWVYPTAVHSRFEHSLGTSYLARLLMIHLQHIQEDISRNLNRGSGNEELQLEITDADIKCAELAGLLHDIGHGPFSHVWDSRIVPYLEIGCKHEIASIEIIDWMIEEYGLKEKLEKEGLNDDHIRVIKEMIYPDYRIADDSSRYYRRDQIKSFMYEIISNGHCELDVDKFDYLARDGKMLGTFSLESHTDLQRLIRMTTVARDQMGFHLSWRAIAAMTVVNVFQVRHRLHRVAYKHRTSVAIELMVSDALKKAAETLRFRDAYAPSTSEKSGKSSKVNVRAFIRLTDHIIWQILLSGEPELEESRLILQRLVNRELYVCLGMISPYRNRVSTEPPTKTEQENQQSMIEIINEITTEEKLRDDAEKAMIISHCRFDFCAKDKNPMDKCLFVVSNGDIIEDNSTALSSMFEPKQMEDVDIRLYSRERSPNVNKLLLQAFKTLCERNGYEKPVVRHP